MTLIESEIAKLLGGGACLTKLAMTFALGISRDAIDRGIARMRADGYVESRQGARWLLTRDGEREACKLLRAEMIALRVEAQRRGAA